MAQARLVDRLADSPSPEWTVEQDKSTVVSIRQGGHHI